MDRLWDMAPWAQTCYWLLPTLHTSNASKVKDYKLQMMEPCCFWFSFRFVCLFVVILHLTEVSLSLCGHVAPHWVHSGVILFCFEVILCYLWSILCHFGLFCSAWWSLCDSHFWSLPLTLPHTCVYLKYSSLFCAFLLLFFLFCQFCLIEVCLNFKHRLLTCGPNRSS